MFNLKKLIVGISSKYTTHSESKTLANPAISRVLGVRSQVYREDWATGNRTRAENYIEPISLQIIQ